MRITYRILLLVVLLCGCTPGLVSDGRPVVPTNSPTPYLLTPSQTATSVQTPTSTPGKLITATVWLTKPQVPIVIYHQFAPDYAASSINTKVRFADFKQELEDLYASGYSLVSFEKWIAGDMEVPPGRHPLILSMDDLFFNNQISLLEDGTPSPDTGIGILWQFYQEHPDFGFHLALFAILGDKFYPFDPQYSSDSQYLGRNWESEFAQTIVWCLEIDARVYNHTFRHGYLANYSIIVTMSEFIQQLRQNDDRLRYYLKLAGREDLIPRLGNVIALPGGAQPQTESDWATLREYKNPEGLSVQGVLEAGFDTSNLMQPPYSADFDRWHIPRFTATLNSIQTLVQESSQMPTATTCELDSGSGDPAFLGNQINQAIQNSQCLAGIYVTGQYIYDASQTGRVNLLFKRTDNSSP